MALLVHLDRIDAAIVTLVFKLLDGVAKGVVDFADAMAEDVGKTQQDGQLNPPGLKLIDELLEIDGLVLVLVRVDRDMPGLVDAEVPFAPMTNPIGFHGIVGLPLLDQFHQGMASA